MGGHLALALATGLVADGLLQRATDAEARWGTTRIVLVATSALAPGDTLAGRTVARRLPALAVPEGAVARAGAGAVAVDAIGAGEVVTEARVGGPGAAGLAGRLPPGTRAVLVPLEVPGLPVRVGDHVDLLGVTSPTRPWPGPRRSSSSAPTRSWSPSVPPRRWRWPRPSGRARSSPPS